MNTNNSNAPAYNPGPAKIFASVVYVGVVLAASTLFISFVLTAFPGDAYLSRAIMVVAGMLIGASAICFPIALHSWTIEKTHHAVTTAFYYGEIGILAINTVVAFMILLSKNAGVAAPEWALWYEPFSVAAIIYTMVAWGTVFLLDPEHKRIQQTRQLKDNYEKKVAAMRDEFLGSVEGKGAVANAAAKDIEAMLAADRNGEYHFGVPADNKPIPAEAPFVNKAADMNLLADLQAKVEQLQSRINNPKV